MTAVDVAIINWNTSNAAIASARAYGASRGVDANVAIFDNASEPEQRAILDQAGGVASVILSNENLGFGAAANRILEGGSADFVLISNADVAPEPDAVVTMVESFTVTRGCGLVGPVLEGSEHYHDSLPGPLTLTIRMLFGSFNRRPIGHLAPGTIREVDQVSGACFLTSRSLWESIGGFDERFFLWYEDVDLAKRLNKLGRKSIIAGSARVHHTGGQAFLKLPAGAKQEIRLDSLSLYLRLHHPFVYLLSRPLAFVTRAIRGHR